jgi:SAM-dependent methyltransferase
LKSAVVDVRSVHQDSERHFVPNSRQLSSPRFGRREKELSLKTKLKAIVPERFRERLLLVRSFGSKGRAKRHAEFSFWRSVHDAEGTLYHEHYMPFFTSFFGLDRSFYSGKRLLDIGCGPRGSLEWAGDAAERVGLDPLVESYRALGIDRHSMSYVGTGSEQIPFADGYFDVVSSFNSLDHVDDLERTIAEIKRVTKPGGLFLLLTDVGHQPTVTEPIAYSWSILRRFQPEFAVVDERHFEKPLEGMYKSLDAGIPYDHANEADRYGLLAARLTRV